MPSAFRLFEYKQITLKAGTFCLQRGFKKALLFSRTARPTNVLYVNKLSTGDSVSLFNNKLFLHYPSPIPALAPVLQVFPLRSFTVMFEPVFLMSYFGVL